LAASKKAHDAAIKSYRNLAESLPFRVDALVTEIRDTQKNYNLYADALLVQSEQWARSALSAYEVGKIEFNTMINAEIRLLRNELRAKRYVYTIYQKLAELEETIGGPWSQ
jgi:outer membrane protein TolC